MRTRKPSVYYRGTNAPGPIAREAATQRIPFAFNKPKPLQLGQAYRMIRARGTEDSADATARARAMPWWSGVVSPTPIRASSEWWLWTVKLAKCR